MGKVGLSEERLGEMTLQALDCLTSFVLWFLKLHIQTQV